MKLNITSITSVSLYHKSFPFHIVNLQPEIKNFYTLAEYLRIFDLSPLTSHDDSGKT